MSYVCGTFLIEFAGSFRDYSDLNAFVSNQPDIQGVLLGEDASDFVSFYGIEARQPFSGAKFRIGTILDNSRGSPRICPIHSKASLAIGMNDAVLIADLESSSIAKDIKLGSFFHHFLCNGNVLAAIHELGAAIISMSTLHEMKNVYCDVVADASLSDSELVLTSMSSKVTHVRL